MVLLLRNLLLELLQSQQVAWKLQRGWSVAAEATGPSWESAGLKAWEWRLWAAVARHFPVGSP